MKLVAQSSDPINKDEFLQHFAATYEINKNNTMMYDTNDAGLLFIACQNGNVGTVERLLTQEGIEINKARSDGVTPLYIACQNGHDGIVKLLLTQKGIEIDKTRDDGRTPLFIACQAGHVRIARLLLAQEGIKINKALDDGFTPLCGACHKGHDEIVELLLAQDGIEINKAMPNGLTLLYMVCQMGHLPGVKLLLQSDKADVNVIGLENNTPLLAACLSPATQGLNELFGVLLENNADPFHKNAKGETALDIAFLQKNTAAIEEIFLHAKKKDISLGSLMSAETIEKARHWSLCKPATSDNNRFFKPDCSLADLKHFVQTKLQCAENNVSIPGNKG